MLKKILLFLTIVSQISCAQQEDESLKQPKQPLKILLLIICSDDLQVYLELQKTWRSYMHNNPQQIEAYFLRGNLNQTTTFQYKDDTIWTKTHESYESGVTNKTILTFEGIIPRLHEFDFVVRTNLSSFMIFPRLLKFLESAPKTKFYCGSPMFYNKPPFTMLPYASGSGFILSTDLVALLVENKSLFLNHPHCCDDVHIGSFFFNQGIALVPKNRIDITTIEQWNQNRNKVDPDLFHIRVRSANSALWARLAQEPPVHRKLFDEFYGKNIN